MAAMSAALTAGRIVVAAASEASGARAWWEVIPQTGELDAIADLGLRGSGTPPLDRNNPFVIKKKMQQNPFGGQKSWNAQPAEEIREKRYLARQAKAQAKADVEAAEYRNRLAQPKQAEARGGGSEYAVLLVIGAVAKIGVSVMSLARRRWLSRGMALMRRGPPAWGLLLSLGALATAAAQAPAGRVPMGTGATIVQTLSAAGGDRESVHRVRLASDLGLHYEWLLQEVHPAGDTVWQDFRYLEAWSDLADAKRLRAFHDPKAPEAHPGYTMHALSRAIYRRLREGRSDSLQIMYVDQVPGSEMLSSLGFGGPRMTPVRWRGTIAPATPGTVPFPVLLNGRRVRLPALHARGDFTARQGRWQSQLWILADSSYPLILKWVGGIRETGSVLQTTRIDLPLAKVVGDGTVEGDGTLLTHGDGLMLVEATPRGVAAGGTDQSSAGLERALAASCRVELPGIYFAFNSARLEPASDHAIAELAAILGRHPDWTGTLEGHTDSIGSVVANKALSERRVASVRARLVDQHKVSPTRLRVVGFGAARPREPNSTIEGRARNRRVELVRECAAGE